MSVHNNGYKEDPEGEVSIEDVVNCRIVLVRSIPIELDICSDDETDNGNSDGMTMNVFENHNTDGISGRNVQIDDDDVWKISCSIGSTSVVKEDEVRDTSPMIGKEKKNENQDDNDGMEERATGSSSVDFPPAPVLHDRQQQPKRSMIIDEQPPFSKDKIVEKYVVGHEKVHPNVVKGRNNKHFWRELPVQANDQLPQGWVIHIHRRPMRRNQGRGGDPTFRYRYDQFWWTALGNRLRSKSQVMTFLGHLKDEGGDEKIAWQKMRRTDCVPRTIAQIKVRSTTDNVAELDDSESLHSSTILETDPGSLTVQQMEEKSNLLASPEILNFELKGNRSEKYEDSSPPSREHIEGIYLNLRKDNNAYRLVDKAKDKIISDESSSHETEENSSSISNTKHYGSEIPEFSGTQKAHLGIREKSQETVTKILGDDTSVIELMNDSDLDDKELLYESQNRQPSRQEVQASVFSLDASKRDGKINEENVPNETNSEQKQKGGENSNDIKENFEPVAGTSSYAGVIELIDDSDSEHAESHNNPPNISCKNISLKKEDIEEGNSLKDVTNGGEGYEGCPSSKDFIELLDDADDESDEDLEIIGVSKAACRKGYDDDNDGDLSKSSDQIEYEDRFGTEGEEDEDTNYNNKDIEIMGVFVSEGVRLNLERKMREAAKKRKDKVMNNHGIESNLPDPWTRLPSLSSVVGEKMKRQINTSNVSRNDKDKNHRMKSNVSNPWTYRPPPFYLDVETTTKRKIDSGTRGHSTPSSKKSKVHPKKNIYNYNRDEDQARREQERLFRESAARVKAREQMQRALKMSQGRISCMKTYTEVVMDVSTLPRDHFKWSCLYSRLGVPRKSSFTVVKKNYRKLCLLYHPDKARCEDAPTKFQAIKEAYETIMNEMNT